METVRYCQKGSFGDGDRCKKKLAPDEFFFCSECQKIATEKKSGSGDGFVPVSPTPFWFYRKAFEFNLIGRRPETIKEWVRAFWNVDVFFGWFPWIKAITFVHILLWIWVIWR